MFSIISHIEIAKKKDKAKLPVLILWLPCKRSGLVNSSLCIMNQYQGNDCQFIQTSTYLMEAEIHSLIFKSNNEKSYNGGGGTKARGNFRLPPQNLMFFFGYYALEENSILHGFKFFFDYLGTCILFYL